MSKENKKTLEVYKDKAKMYLDNSVEHDRINLIRAKEKREKIEVLIKDSFSSLPKQGKVFEIGSGDGTNAKFIQNLGYDITASDTADDFINVIRNKGLETVKFNALEDGFVDKYNGIFCWRVFVHFTTEDVKKTINKVYNALEYNGIFIFNAINREIKSVDDEWIDFEGEYHMGAERYYKYFRKEELDDIIKQTKFEIKDFHKEGGENNNKWLVYVLKK